MSRTLVKVERRTRPSGRRLAGQRHRHRAAQRLSDVEDAPRVDPLLPSEGQKGGPGVVVRPLFGRASGAPPVAPVVEGEDVEAGVGQQARVQEAVPDVARVAVAQEHVAEGAPPGPEPPPVQRLPVLGLEDDVLRRPARGRPAGRGAAATESREASSEEAGHMIQSTPRTRPTETSTRRTRQRILHYLTISSPAPWKSKDRSSSIAAGRPVSRGDTPGSSVRTS